MRPLGPFGVFGILFLFAQGLWSQELRAPLDSQRWVIQAHFEDILLLESLSPDLAPWRIDRKAGYFFIDADLVLIAELERLGFEVVIDWTWTERLRQPLAYLAGQESGIPGFPCYPTLPETFAIALDLVAQRPDLATWLDIGDSWEKTQDPEQGNDLMVLKLTNQMVPGPKPALFAMSALHPREYATAALLTDFARLLVNEYGMDADITWLLDYHEIHLLLQANPDGRQWAETGLLWRKNTNNNFCTDSNFRGVDLNRNFDFLWGCCFGSSDNECSDLFRGPSEASEPEIQVIQDYLRDLFPDQRGEDLDDPAPLDATGIFLDVHSFSELVIWSFGFTGEPAPNGTSLQTLGRKLAFFNDYTPLPISQFTTADGSTVDFVYGELGVAAMGYELGTSFFQDCQTYENTIKPDNLESLFYAAKVARTPYLTSSGPDALALQVETGLRGTITLSALIDDTRFNQSNGLEPTQSIVAAEYYLDVPPWDLSGNPKAHSMMAADGNFDSASEAVTAPLDSENLGPQRQLLFVRGMDESGTWGPVSALFLSRSFTDLLTQWPAQVSVLDLLQSLVL